MARDPIGAAVLYFLGLVLAVPAILVLGWMGLAWSDHEWALESALWLLQQSVLPLPLPGPPARLALEMIRPEWIWPKNALIAGAILGLGAFTLGKARTRMRPSSQSEDGLAGLELNTPELQVGHPVEGRLRLLKRSEPGEVFALRLRCLRTYTPPTADDSNDSRTETVFNEELAIAAVQDAAGLSVPFRFMVPITAPASGHTTKGFKWRLEVWRTKAWITFYPGFDLRLAAAAPEELRALEAARPSALRDDVADIERRLVGFGKPALAPYQRAELAAMTPEKREDARRMLEGVDKLTSRVETGLLKIVIGFCLGAVFLFAIGLMVAMIVKG